MVLIDRLSPQNCPFKRIDGKHLVTVIRPREVDNNHSKKISAEITGIWRSHMNQGDYAYFGSSDNQRIQRNAEAIWELIKDDPRYCCHGRAVSLSEGFEENIQLQASLALLQGVGICD
jgi:hypothetical protein